MTAPKPTAKVNPIRQQVLAALIQTKPISWNHRTFDANGDLVETKVLGTTLVNSLAGNVSDLNIDRAAKRWAA